MFDAYSVNTLKLDAERCTGCGICLNVCPHGVFAKQNGCVTLAAAEACMECGACQVNCPFGAIQVESGVGCAASMIRAALSGRKEVTCG
jgi:NAD-dependent dihydropyrimidine dehydrogenase PreA subunit